MLTYILLNKKKLWGLIIFFVGIFAVLTIFNHESTFDSSLQKAWVNLFLAFSLSCFGYVVFLCGAYVDFSRASYLFDSPPFKYLQEKGFKISYTAVTSRFLFSGKRITGIVDGFPVKISGSQNRFTVYIGVDENILERKHKQELTEALAHKGIKYEDIFVEMPVVEDATNKEPSYVYEMLTDLTAFLQSRGFEPRIDPNPKH
ncbi:hypothetical protein [Paraflavitalea sp. CAU 1676]|jgi:hypothetical protein|uniref:hypothetical protein n=1 Tax=Paraflavitalea sp. CAU 1676 TaxID=3032598 RepID=UPI0023DB6CDE|nr:hypothetical protein [Paraflavitalea sp. CAU 1676]MDF2189247.1 hypothetical protein [Paraflavitalea sp. CAU 1676]